MIRDMVRTEFNRTGGDVFGGMFATLDELETFWKKMDRKRKIRSTEQAVNRAEGANETDQEMTVVCANETPGNESLTAVARLSGIAKGASLHTSIYHPTP